MTAFIWFILIGAVAGWIASKVMKKSFGMIANILLGIVGGVVGGWVFSFLGLSASSASGALLTSVAGAIIVLYIAGMVRK